MKEKIIAIIILTIETTLWVVGISAMCVNYIPGNWPAILYVIGFIPFVFTLLIVGNCWEDW